MYKKIDPANMMVTVVSVTIEGLSIQLFNGPIFRIYSCGIDDGNGPMFLI